MTLALLTIAWLLLWTCIAQQIVLVAFTIESRAVVAEVILESPTVPDLAVGEVLAPRAVMGDVEGEFFGRRA